MKKILLLNIMLLAISGSAAETLNLSQCLNMAKVHNRQLQNAAIDIEAASEQQKEAHTKYYPQISANVMAFQAFDKMVKADGTIPESILLLGQQFAPYVGMPYSFHELNRGYNASVSVMEPLYVGGQITTGNKLAQLQKDCQVLQLSLKEKDVMQKVTENYWQIAQLKYNLRTLDAADKQIEALLEQVNNYVKAGVTTRNDLLKVKLRQQELKSTRLKVSNGERILLLLLAQQIGAESDIDISLSEQAQQEVLPQACDGQTAVENRAEMQLALKNVEAQQLQLKMEHGKLMPTIAVGAMGYHCGLGGLSKTVKNNMETTMTNGLVLATLQVPISDWWGGKHALRRSKLKARQAQNDADDAREKLLVDIEAAWLNVTEAYEQIGVQKTSVEQAEENLRMNTDMYKAGTTTITDLLDAETLLRKAKDELANAMATYQVRLADYQRKVK